MFKVKVAIGVLAIILLLGSTTYAAYYSTAGPHGSNKGITSQDRLLSPAGKQVTLGDFPMAATLSPDGNYLIVSNDGQGIQSLEVIDTHNQKVIQTIPYPSPEALYLGIAFSPDGGTLYVSAGGNNKIRVFQFSKGKLQEKDPILLENKEHTNFYPAGLSVSPDGRFLYVANNLDNSVSKINVEDKTWSRTNVGQNPYMAFLTGDGHSLFVSNWGENSLTVLDPDTMKVRTTIETGLHPNAIAENPKTNDIYVVNSDSDTISVINPVSLKVKETISVKPSNTSPTGSQPDSICISNDGTTLYVGNAGDNAVSVFRLKGDAAYLKGLIPTSWYPTGVYLNKEQNALMVLNAKGLGAGPNNDGKYIGNMMMGTLSFIKIPNWFELKYFTRQVKKNNGINQPANLQQSIIPRNTKEESPIKHVIYIIKENRTYDQVLGDLPQGNGDPGLTAFGEKVTPNIHKLAMQFVTLDNFYADAEVSAQGHNWSTAAKANDYVEKNWMANYSKRNREYDFEGENEATYPESGFLWDNALKSGVSFMDFGEFMEYDQDSKRWIPKDLSIGMNYDPAYPGWDLDISDLKREREWEKTFQTFEKKGDCPSLQIIRLPNDHTIGTTPGELTPRSMVAQNDAAVGKLVEAVSHSKFWKDTVIFITEDDAQNGWDHVDAHRTVSLAISPYTQTGKVDSTFYDTTSMIHTIELILGMKPMTQFDASSIPMTAAFTGHPDFTPYTSIGPLYPLDERNTVKSPGAKASKSMDFSKADDIDDGSMNHILWEDTMHGKRWPYKKERKD